MSWLTWDAETHPEDHALVLGVWPDAALADDATVAAALAAAFEQCAAFAPATTPTDPVPARCKQAQALQARALAQAGAVAVNGEMPGAFPIQTFPMDWTVKALLRPPRAPRVG